MPVLRKPRGRPRRRRGEGLPDPGSTSRTSATHPSRLGGLHHSQRSGTLSQSTAPLSPHSGPPLDRYAEEFLAQHAEEFQEFMRQRRQKGRIDEEDTSSRGRPRRFEHAGKQGVENFPARESLRPQHSQAERYRDQGVHSRAHRTPQEASIEEELTKLIGIGEEDEILTPFTDDINAADLPQEFTWPAVTSYDGTTDPRVLLSNFNHAMLNQNCTTVHICKVFPEWSSHGLVQRAPLGDHLFLLRPRLCLL